ncbi:hypothetical protein CDAR_508291 [Caerostris darwini]|uniref:DNA2/NAM7 helicase-like C-terminal domain-containing protein n=1 Tax=Caerostris darwini TaxID=1538125 RepID=A0AAV4WR09_9ARAC|nr:hypothetical protein CDAR_508291 [Caerostris darwini]
MEGIDFQWPRPDIRVFFNTCQEQEEMSGSGTSYLNTYFNIEILLFSRLWTEASEIGRIVTRFVSGGAKSQQIGIIIPYEEQKKYLTKYI